MKAAILGIFYRNMHLFKRYVLYNSLLLVGLSLFNLSLAQNAEQVVFGIYIIMFSNQFVPIFVHSMVDDRSNKFKTTFKVMGLQPLPYVIGQVLSFSVIAGVSMTLFTFFITCYVLRQDPLVFDSFFKALIPISILMAPLIATFSIVLSFLFSTAKSAKDLSLLFSVGLIGLSINSILNVRFLFLRWISPFYPPMRLFTLTLFGKFSPENYGLNDELIPILFQTGLYMLLGCYLEQVFPGGDDLGKHPFFFLKRKSAKERKVVEDLSLQDREMGETQTGLLEINGLTKKFGNFVALDSLSLSLSQGQTCCLLGPNGAGKSTFIGLLSGALRQDRGSVTFEGRDLKTQLQKGELTIGICPGYEFLYEPLSARAHLKTAALLKGLDSPDQRADQMIRFLRLGELANLPSAALSGGAKRKITLGMALIGGPKVLLLDEPTSSLDPISRHEVWSLLEAARATSPKLLCLLTTHHLEEAERLADEVAVLCSGKLQFKGSVPSMKETFGFAFRVDVFPSSTNSDPSSSALAPLDELFTHFVGESNMTRGVARLEARLPPARATETPTLLLRARQLTPEGFELVVNSNTLEQAYLALCDEVPGPAAEELNDLVDRLPRRAPPTSRIRIILLAKTKLAQLFADSLELVKLIVAYVMMACVGRFLLSIELPMKWEMIIDAKGRLWAVLGVQIFVEVFVTSWPALNVVHEKASQIKALIYVGGVTPLAYYISKMLADLCIVLPAYLGLFLVYDWSAPSELRPTLGVLFRIVFYWRLAFMCSSFLISSQFSDVRSAQKYFSLTYSAFAGCAGALAWAIGFTFPRGFSDLSLLGHFLTNSENLASNELLIALAFFSQATVFVGGLAVWESLDLSFNFRDLGEGSQKIETTSGGGDSLRAKKLAKRFGSLRAVDGVSFSLSEGGSFGLVGPNGAGKSTVFSLLVGALRKSGGSVSFGRVSRRPSLLKNPFEGVRVSACFQNNAMWEELTGEAHLNFFSEFWGTDKGLARQIARALDLEHHLSKPAGQLSSGNRRKLCTAGSLLAGPALLFFDEATTGVDLAARLRLRAFLQRLVALRHMAAVHTTHFLKDVELFCESVGVLQTGKFLCVQRVETLKAELGGISVSFVPISPNRPANLVSELTQIARLDSQRETPDGRIHLTLRQIQDPIEMFLRVSKLQSQGKIKAFLFNQLSVEDIYVQLVSKQ